MDRATQFSSAFVEALSSRQVIFRTDQKAGRLGSINLHQSLNTDPASIPHIQCYREDELNSGL